MFWVEDHQRRAPSLATAALGFFAAVSCSSARPAEEYPKTGLADGVVTLEPTPSPGVYLYRPRAGDVRDATERRVASYHVVLGNSGQRWLRGKKGELVAAQQLAPEPLIEVGKSDGELPYWYLGQSGRVYRSATVLGVFDAESVTTPPEVLVRVTTGSGVILGVNVGGRLLRSVDQGQSWSQVNVAGRVVDAALLPSGVGLVLTSPETYHQTRDAGATWEPILVNPFGGLRLEPEEGGIDALGVLGRRRWTPERPTEFKPNSRNPTHPEVDPTRLQRFASANAITNGSAVLDQHFYQEVESLGSEVVLWRGKVTEVLERAPVAVNGCREPHLSGGRDALFLICGAIPGKVSLLRVYKSTDEGKNFVEEPYKLRGDGNWLTVLPWRGHFVWTGICDPEAEPTGCVPSGVYRAQPSGDKTAFHELRLLGLSGVALAMTVAPVSGRLLVFGATNKGDELTLYAGDDPAAPFELSPLRDVRLPRSSGAMVVSRPAWGEDGYVAATVMETRNGNTQLVVADEQGQVLHVRPGPNNGNHVSGVGMRALAVDARSSEIWESVDGGERWQTLGRAPTEFCPSARQQICDVSLACFAQGCLLGDQLTRLGWSGQSGQLDAPPELVFPKPKVELQTPIVCRVTDDAGWKVVPGGQIPEATGAALGDVDWFTHHVDWAKASVSAYEMDYAVGDNATLREEVVFERQADPAKWVVFSSSQTEGVAALRGKVDGGALDVAWRNLFRSTKTHRWPLRANQASATDRWTHTPTRALARAGQPGLLSIAAGGIFVRPGIDERLAKTWLVRENGATRELPPLIWTEIAATGRTEMSQVGETPLALKLFRNGSALVRARPFDDVWQLGAVSVGVDEPGRFNLHQSYDLGYYQGQPHYHLWQVGETSEAWLFPLQEQGPVLGQPIAAATQATLGPEDEPQVCDAEARKSARVVAPAEGKTMHPIVVRHNSEPTKLYLTRNAVLYGLRDEACVAVYEGEAVVRTKSEEAQVLVRPERGQPSWMFRRAAGEPAFEYRPITCEFDVNEPIPSDVLGLLDD